MSWKFSDDDSVLKEKDEVLGIVDENDQPVLSIGWGGFSCESDPHGAYPVLEASPQHWALIQAAPDLLAALEPFADLLGEDDDDFADNERVVVRCGRWSDMTLTLGDIRRAVAAISKATPDTTGGRG